MPKMENLVIPWVGFPLLGIVHIPSELGPKLDGHRKRIPILVGPVPVVKWHKVLKGPMRSFSCG